MWQLPHFAWRMGCTAVAYETTLPPVEPEPEPEVELPLVEPPVLEPPVVELPPVVPPELLEEVVPPLLPLDELLSSPQPARTKSPAAQTAPSHFDIRIVPPAIEWRPS